jgi:hypothetical protein
MTGADRPPLLSPDWWEETLETWNRSAERGSLSRFGLAGFELSESTLDPVWIHWDSEGKAERRPRGTYDTPRFAATEANWTAFFDGQFSLAMGVMRLKIRFRGPVRRVLPFIAGLNTLARIAGSRRSE